MKLFELLDTSKITGDLICRPEDNWCIRYSPEVDCFAWAWTNTGDYVIDNVDSTGYFKTQKRVDLNGNVIDCDTWYLSPKFDKEKSSFDGKCVGAPVIHRGIPIGVVNSFDGRFANITLWGRYAGIEIDENGNLAAIEIAI